MVITWSGTIGAVATAGRIAGPLPSHARIRSVKLSAFDTNSAELMTFTIGSATGNTAPANVLDFNRRYAELQGCDPNLILYGTITLGKDEHIWRPGDRLALFVDHPGMATAYYTVQIELDIIDAHTGLPSESAALAALAPRSPTGPQLGPAPTMPSEPEGP